MQIRAQRQIGELLLPQSRRQGGHARGRMPINTLKHIDDLIVDVDLVQPEARDQTLQDTDVLRANLAPAK